MKRRTENAGNTPKPEETAIAGPRLTGEPYAWLGKMDLIDEGGEFVARAELPGVAREDVDLNVTTDGIEIRARSECEHEEKDKDHYYRERSYRALQRFLPFPAEVLAEQARATLKDGVLEVRTPKKEPTPGRKPVKVRVE